MTQQPDEEWDDMTQQRQDEIKARVIAACDTDANAAPTYRQRIVRAARPSSRVAEAFRRTGI